MPRARHAKDNRRAPNHGMGRRNFAHRPTVDRGNRNLSPIQVVFDASRYLRLVWGREIGMRGPAFLGFDHRGTSLSQAMKEAITVDTDDITALRQALFQEREAAESLRLIVDHVPAHIAYFDNEQRYVFVNKSLAEVYSLPPQYFIGKHASEIQMQHQYKANRPFFDAALRGEKTTYEREVVVPDGSVNHFQTSYVPHFGEGGRVIGFFALSVDIGERMKAERELQNIARRLRLITDNLPAWIAYTDAEQRYRFANPTVAQWHARPVEDIIGKTVVELTGPNYEKLRPHIGNVLAGEQVTFVEEFSYGDGATRFVHANYVPHIGDDGRVEGYFSLIDDISDLQQAEEKLRQAQKMEAMGQLTGGVAHDFNNLLAVILANTELLGDQMGGDKMGAGQLLGNIKSAATRGGELTARLLSFSRQQALRPQAVDLTELVPGLRDLIRRTLGEMITVKVEVPENIWPVLADPGQLENALLNLAINARDAMPGGGVLEIACCNTEIPADDADLGDADLGDGMAAGRYVQIAVCDTGAGMSQEVRDHAFEPFYTTKGVGDGSGLGLSMVYGFAQQSGGDIVIESEPGTGTQVKIRLPRATTEAVSSEPTRASDLEQGQGKVILVLEDDPAVRDSTVLVLQGLGYKALEAGDAKTAMRILEEEAGNLDLLLSDVVLPGGVSGPEFAYQAKALSPKLKIVFMSGYPADHHSHNNIQSFDEILLTKPFQRADLNRAIQDTLAT